MLMPAPSATNTNDTIAAISTPSRRGRRGDCSAVAASDLVKSWGTFTPDTLNIAEVAKFEPAAGKLVDEVEFND